MKKIAEKIFMVTAEMFLLSILVTLIAGMFMMYDISLISMIIGIIAMVINTISIKSMKKED